jgi:hypothetical protein
LGNDFWDGAAGRSHHQYFIDIIAVDIRFANGIIYIVAVFEELVKLIFDLVKVFSVVFQMELLHKMLNR